MVQDSEAKLMKIKNSPENRAKCHCKVCPSYPFKCGGEDLYCGKGPSKCDVDAEICICDTCPIYFEYDLNGIYFCDKDMVGENKVFMRKKRSDEDNSRYQSVVDIKDSSAVGKSVIGSMGSLKELPYSLEDLYFLPAQVKTIPLNLEDPVKTHIIIGSDSKKPLELSCPIMISGLSFGAVSKSTKLVISKTASDLNIGFNSGEGGVLNDEISRSSNMILQYSTGRFGVDDELLKNAAAIEIRFGQGAYPGKGSYLPAEKMTSEVAKKRGLENGEPSYSPAHHPDITKPMDLRKKISELRKISSGAPVGAKIGCGNVEDDVKILVKSGVDFIALDGFGGGTGATEKYVRENVGIPIYSALPRAYKKLQELKPRRKVSLIASGGLRNSADFAKCLAMGADAVYIGTAALIAINCEQYRLCYTGKCPTGIATQNPKLVKQIDIDEGVKKLSNFIRLSTDEIANLTRITGKDNVKKLDQTDLVSVSRDMAAITGVKWINGEFIMK